MGLAAPSAKKSSPATTTANKNKSWAAPVSCSQTAVIVCLVIVCNIFSTNQYVSKRFFLLLFCCWHHKRRPFRTALFFHPTPATITLPEHPTYHPPMLSTQQQQHSHTRHVYWLWLSGLSEFKFALCQRSGAKKKTTNPLKSRRPDKKSPDANAKTSRLKTGLNDRQDARAGRTNGREINHPNVDHHPGEETWGRCSQVQRNAACFDEWSCVSYCNSFFVMNCAWREGRSLLAISKKESNQNTLQIKVKFKFPL